MSGEIQESEERSTFYRQGKHGYYELVDVYTGAIISIQGTLHPLPKAEFIEAVIDGNKVLVQSGIDCASLTGIKSKHMYSEALADVIAQKIIDDVPISQMHKIPGMPDAYTIAVWRRRHQEFDELVRFARKARAERMRDDALEKAKAADGSLAEFVAGTKLAVDTLKWAAEKDDPEVYGKNIKIDGQIGIAQLIVETGIRRAGDAGVKDVGESKVDGQVGEEVQDLVPDEHGEHYTAANDADTTE